MVDWREHIVHDPKICGGVATAKGTRVMVTVILDNLAAGTSEDEILKQYPSLTREHLRAAIGFAAELAREEVALPLS